MPTLDEAIKELTKIVGKWQFSASNERDAALQLGIEALIRVKNDRATYYYPKDFNLPGETKK